MSEMHKLTSYSDGFGIFNKVAEHEFDVDNKNYLRLFMLNTENNVTQVLAQKKTIVDFINKYKIRNYEFNFYFLPFHDAMKDRRSIMQKITKKQRYFTQEA